MTKRREEKRRGHKYSLIAAGALMLGVIGVLPTTTKATIKGGGIKAPIYKPVASATMSGNILSNPIQSSLKKGPNGKIGSLVNNHAFDPVVNITETYCMKGFGCASVTNQVTLGLY